MLLRTDWLQRLHTRAATDGANLLIVCVDKTKLRQKDVWRVTTQALQRIRVNIAMHSYSQTRPHVEHVGAIVEGKQEAQLSPRDRAMRRVNWNLANCHATVQKLLIRQVLTKSMVWSWRFSRRQCVIDNVHSTMTRSSRLPLSQVS